MSGCDVQSFKYGIHNLNNPDALVPGGISDTGAPDPFFGAD
jgi:hypothetical protein